jgi:flavin-dependent dehydrogenase
MAGASVAWRLAGAGASVLVLEREPQPDTTPRAARPPCSWKATAPRRYAR